MSNPAKRIVAAGIVTVGTTAVKIVSEDIGDYDGNSIMVISDDGGAPNGNTALIRIGDVDNIAADSPGIRPGATWGTDDTASGSVEVDRLYAIADAAGQKLMYFVMGWGEVA